MEERGLLEVHTDAEGREGYRLTEDGLRLGNMLAMVEGEDAEAVLETLLPDDRRSIAPWRRPDIRSPPRGTREDAAVCEYFTTVRPGAKSRPHRGPPAPRCPRHDERTRRWTRRSMAHPPGSSSFCSSRSARGSRSGPACRGRLAISRRGLGSPEPGGQPVSQGIPEPGFLRLMYLVKEGARMRPASRTQQTVGDMARQQEHSHPATTHVHDHYHVSHHHTGGLLSGFEHRAEYHSHEHDHPALVHGHEVTRAGGHGTHVDGARPRSLTAHRARPRRADPQREHRQSRRGLGGKPGPSHAPQRRRDSRGRLTQALVDDLGGRPGANQFSRNASTRSRRRAAAWPS
jgi:hypothetical protein